MAKAREFHEAVVPNFSHIVTTIVIHEDHIFAILKKSKPLIDE